MDLGRHAGYARTWGETRVEEAAVRNHYIRLAEIVQEGVTREFAGIFRDPERKPDLDEVLQRLAQIRTAHQEQAARLWQREGRISEALRQASARADLCAFFTACLTGGAAEFRETALEAMEVVGAPGEKEMVRILARRVS